MMKLLSDKGHGPNTWPPSKGIYAAGGVPGMAEYDFNSAIGEEVKRLLKGKIPVYEGQTGYTDVSLYTRANRYNAEYREDQSAIGMSYHGNANANKKTRGFGVFYWQGSAKGKRLAELVLAEYKKEFANLPIWGDGLFESKIGDWTNFAILRETAAPFVLIEWEFFTNDAARKLMLTDDYRKRCGKVAAKAACSWYGVPFEEEPKPVPVVKPSAKEEIQLPKKEYRDVSPTHATAWGWAEEKGFLNGERPGEPLSREQFATVLKRLYADLKK